MKDIYIRDILSENKILYYFFNPDKSILVLAFRFIIVFYSLPVILFLVSLFDNKLFVEGAGTGFLQDYLFLSTSFFVAPAFMLLLRIILQRFVMLINSVNSFTKNNSRDKTSEILNQTLDQVRKKNRSLLLMKILLGVIVFSSNMSSVFKRQDSWNSFPNSLEFYLTAIWIIIVISVVTNQVFFKYLSLIVAQIKFTKSLTLNNLIEIKPLHPDKSGGLKLLGNLALSYTYFLFPILLIIIAHMITWQYVTVGLALAVSSYVPLIIFVFFYPLGIVHDTMIKAKLEILNKISNHFHTINSELLVNDKLDEKYLLEKKPIIELLDNLYQKADGLPNWPFDTVTLTKFFTIVLAIISSIWFKWLLRQMFDF